MNNPPINKVPLSVSNPALVESMKADEQNKYQEMRKKGLFELYAKMSIVPIGLYAFSKYNKYDTKKTIKVTVIGSVVILGAYIINGLSGAWGGNTIADNLFGSKKNKLIPMQNTSNNNKQCKKWRQVQCKTYPCPAECEEYEK